MLTSRQKSRRTQLMTPAREQPSAFRSEAVAIPVPAAPNSQVPSVSSADRRSALGLIGPYLSIARPDHWCKNVFMALGVVLAYFCHPEGLGLGALAAVLWAVATTCLVASSNYVLNEILDAPTDRSHPVKRHRPIPAGQVHLGL